MNRFASTVAALCAFPALATADQPVPSGFYVGLSAGGGIASSDARPTLNSGSAPIEDYLNLLFNYPSTGELKGRDEQFVGGLHAGWSRYYGHLLVGVEGDVSSARFNVRDRQNPDSLFFDNRTDLSTDLEWLATLRGRIGFLATDRVTLFATAGAAITEADSRLTLTNTSGGAFVISEGNSRVACGFNAQCYASRDSDRLLGWLVGGGVEYAISEKVSLRAEYTYIDFEDFDVRALGGTAFGFESTPDNRITTDADLDVHTITAGISFFLN
jgi:outer membrane immunogenic protein